jgi:Arc/MetJ-type ribon-helix-helix transcriptional regulator
MVRKQIYLGEDEDRRIKQIARSEGRSEAAVIRDAIRRLLEEEDSRDAAWDRLTRMLEALPSTGVASDRFDRSEAYRGRTDRYDDAR